MVPMVLPADFTGAYGGTQVVLHTPVEQGGDEQWESAGQVGAHRRDP